MGITLPEALDADTNSRDLRLEGDNEMLTPTEDLKDVRIDFSPQQAMKIGNSLIEKK